VSTQNISCLDSTAALHDVFQSIRADSERIETFVDEQRQELQQLREQLHARAEQLLFAEGAIAEQRDALANEQRQHGVEHEALDKLRAETEAQRAELEREAERLAAQRQESEAVRVAFQTTQEQFSTEQATAQQVLEAAQAQLQQDREAFAKQRETSDEEGAGEALVELEQSRRALSELKEQLAEVTADRDRLASELDVVSTEAEHMTVTAQELTETRAELATMREQLTETSPEDGADSVVLRKQLQEMERECVGLENDLEQVRNRAAEFAEAAEKEKRMASQERHEWAGELKEMRRMLEQQNASSSQGPAATTSTSEHVAAAAAVSDPVLDSVLAQFEMLQKDRGRRRKHDTADEHQHVA